MTCVVIDFDEWKSRPFERPPPKGVTIKEPVKKQDTPYERRVKAEVFIKGVHSQYWHKFSYPLLASRFPKDYHSFDVLHGHIFNRWGTILNDNDFPISQPGIWFAKQEAYARYEEIISFLAWRMRKYEECKSYYGDDLTILEDCINNAKIFL
jgi:hypothetical protein